MPKKLDELSVCGHVNKHHYNRDKKLEDLPCDLEKGHAGDHHAKYPKNEPDPITNSKGQVVEERYKEVEAEAFWSDAAGMPANMIHAAEVEQLTMYQKDLLMGIMSKNDGMKVEEALAQAKLSAAWLAGNV